MKKRENIILQKLSEEELSAVRGGYTPSGWKCDEEMPEDIAKRPTSCVYQAWIMAHCTKIDSCSPTTWNPC